MLNKPKRTMKYTDYELMNEATGKYEPILRCYNAYVGGRGYVLSLFTENLAEDESKFHSLISKGKIRKIK